MGLDRHTRFSRHVLRSRRWPALRQQAIRRDNWQCVICGARGRLEADHIESVRKRPDLAYSLANLQTLCGPCHTRKTRIEIGVAPLNPARQAWARLVRETHRNPIEHERKTNA